VIDADDALSVEALLLLRGRRSIKGWYSGTSIVSPRRQALR
jgi:hypothetical protein